jgi:hypothetical protein
VITDDPSSRFDLATLIITSSGMDGLSHPALWRRRTERTVDAFSAVVAAKA